MWLNKSVALIRRLRPGARPIRWKIMAPYALLCAVFAILGTYLVTRLVSGSLEERFTNQLVESARVTSDAMVRRERQHLSTARAVAFTSGLPEAVAAGDAGTAEALVLPLAANNQAEVVEVLNSSGQRLYGTILSGDGLTHSDIEDADDRGSWAIVSDVLSGRKDQAGDKFAAIRPTRYGLALYTAGPIVSEGRVVGVVLVGSLLESFLPAARAESFADITFYDRDGRALATTFALDAAELASLSPSAGGQLPFRDRRTLFGRDFDFLYGELVVRGEVVGLYSVGLPTSYIASAEATARWQMSALFAAVTLAVLVVGWLVSRTLTAPLLRLVGAARAVSAGDLTARSAVRGKDEIGVLASTFDTMTERLQRQHLATIGVLASAIDARDPYTAGHSVRVGQLAATIGRELGMTEERVQHLTIGGYLHDIGKIGVRDAVLLKKGALTRRERELIERHPVIGLDILAPVEFPLEVLEFVGGHHERLDGGGYPRRLKGTEVGRFARIAAVADVYDALTTDRPYRQGVTAAEAVEMLARQAADGHLDGEVVTALSRTVPAWEERRMSDPLLKGARPWAQLIAAA